MANGANYTDAEIDELVSHVLALRKDYVQQLLSGAGIPYSGFRKNELRGRVREAIADGRLTVEGVVEFLDRVEPGGKQHVFLLRPSGALNNSWRDAVAMRRRLAREVATRDLLAAPLPLLMPEELQLSSVRLADGVVEVTGVEARRYTERDESYDRTAVTEEGLPVQLRAFVERVARSTIVLRWDTATRHAALHITQATGRGLERDHYRRVADRCGSAVDSFLDFSEFRDVNLHRVIHELGQREKANRNVLTRSRRGSWDTPNGAELRATSASTAASVYSDRRLSAAIGQVADAGTGQAGNVYWLPGGNGSPLSEELHLTIVASDSRVHFMVPSSTEIVQYVVGQIRRLL